jgi:hypothetical protein
LSPLDNPDPPIVIPPVPNFRPIPMGKWIPPVDLVVGSGLTDANVGESDGLRPRSTSSSSRYDAGGGVGGRMRDDDDQSEAAIFFQRSFLSDSYVLNP